MSFGQFNTRQSRPMADINVTPMVDVMLVLLVIFIIAAPLFTRALQLDLPTSKAPAIEDKTPPVVVSISSTGALYWQEEPVTEEVLATKFQAAAQASTPPVLQLKADKTTQYERITDIMSLAQDNGLSRISFVTHPKTQQEEKK